MVEALEPACGNLCGIYEGHRRTSLVGRVHRICCAVKRQGGGARAETYAEFMRKFMKRRGESARVSCAHRTHNVSR